MVPLGVLIFKDATLPQRLMPLVRQQPLPGRRGAAANPRAGLPLPGLLALGAADSGAGAAMEEQCRCSAAKKARGDRPSPSASAISPSGRQQLLTPGTRSRQSGRETPLTGAARRSAGPRPCAPARPLSAACCSCPPPSPPACGHSPAG